MNRNAWIIGAVILILVIIGFYALSANNGDNQVNTEQNQGGANQNIREARPFDITASNFRFSESEIRVKRGDEVKIRLSNTEGMHNWVIDEFNAKTETITAGQSAEVTFVADKTGTFEYYCGIGNHRQMGMKGNLVVE